MGYDEELSRVISFATAAKEALPGVQVVAPSTCDWWFCESNPGSSSEDRTTEHDSRDRLDQRYRLHR